MKKRKYLQRISLLLGCLFIFNLAYPATADAADALRTVLAEIRAEQDAADKIPLSKFVPDDSEMRSKHVEHLQEFDTEYMTVYLNDDGTRTVYSHAAPVRYKDENGEWVEIDNTLESVQTAKTRRVASISDDAAFINKSNIFTNSFPQRLDGSQGIESIYENYKIQLTPVFNDENAALQQANDAVKALVQKTDDEIEREAAELKEKLSDTLSEDQAEQQVDVQLNPNKAVQKNALNTKTEIEGVQYNPLPNMKFEYFTTHTGFKEVIRIESKPSSNQLMFRLVLQGLRPVVLGDNSVEFYDLESGERVAVMDPMFMEDSYTGDDRPEGKHFSTEIDTTIEPIEGEAGVYMLTATLDQSFLDDPDTVYPILIDPAASWEAGKSRILDTYVLSKYPTYNKVGSYAMPVGQNSGEGIMRGYVKFNIPYGNGFDPYLINSATYKIYETSGYTSAAYLQVSRVTSNWDPNTLNWNTRPADSAHADPLSNVLLNKKGWYTLDITTYVRRWAENAYGVGGYPNYGMRLREVNDTTKKYYRCFNTANAANYTATMTINYESADTVAPNPVPSLTVTPIPGAVGSSTGSVRVQWGASKDLPAMHNSGIKQYRVQILRQSNSTELVSTKYFTASQGRDQTITGVPNATSFFVRIAVQDNAGNWSTNKNSSVYTLPNRTPPTAPTWSISPNNAWTTTDAPTLTWSGANTATGAASAIIQIKINNGNWMDTGWTGAAGTKTMNYQDFLADGDYTIALRVKDAEGNTTESTTVQHFKVDRKKPTVDIVSPQPSYVTGSVDIKATITDEKASDAVNAVSGIREWEVRIYKGLLAFGTPIATQTGSGAKTVDDTLYTWNLADEQNGLHTIVVNATDNAGNSSSKQVAVTVTDRDVTQAQIEIVSPKPEYGMSSLQFTDPNQLQVPITYNVPNGVVLTKIALVVDGEIIAQETRNEENLTENGQIPISLSVLNYHEAVEQGGSLGHEFYLVGEDAQGNLYYSVSTTYAIKYDSFDKITDQYILNNVQVNDGTIYLADNQTQGTIQATLFSNLNNYESNAVTFNVAQEVPLGTSIEYFYRTQRDPSDESEWHAIQPGQTLREGIKEGSRLQVKAVLKGDGKQTPILHDWNWQITNITAWSGHLFGVHLVDYVWNIGTEANANYTIKVTWDDDVNGEGTRYDVYRSETGMPGSFELVAENLTQKFWYDYNLEYGKTFIYQVDAHTQVDGHELYSGRYLFSASAQVVPKNELDRKLGLQDFWTYSSFRTGGGTGYVNVANGNLVYQVTDNVYPGGLLAMVMRRTYNSQSNTKNALAYGWDFSYNTRLLLEYATEQDAPGDYPVVGVILKDGDGSLHRFAAIKDGNGEITGYQAPAGVFMELRELKDANGATIGWEIKRKDNIVYHFDKEMLLRKMSEPNGNYIEFSYTDSGYLDVVRSSEGAEARFIYYTYDENATALDEKEFAKTANTELVGLLAQVEMPYADAQENPLQGNNKVVQSYRYEFDSAAQHTRLIQASLRMNDGSPGNFYEENYVYANGHWMNKIVDPRGNETSWSYEDTGNDREYKIKTITFADDESTTLTYGDQQVVISSSFGFSNALHYDEQGFVTKIVDEDGNQTYYTKNEQLQVTSQEFVPSGNQQGSAAARKIMYSYDANGNITAQVAADGTITRIGGYNQWNKPTWSAVALTENLTLEGAKPDRNANGIALTEYEYDANGNLTKQTDALGNTVQNTYENGLLKTTNNGFGLKTVYEYDNNGWVISVKRGPDTEESTSDSYREITYTYDRYGNGASQTDELGRITSYEYDRLNRLVKKTLPTINGQAPTESYTYDMNHNISTAVDVTGVKVQYAYDELDYLVGQTVRTSNNEVLQETGKEYGTYAISEGKRAYVVTNTDPVGRINKTYYDEKGRVVKQTSVDGNAERVNARYEYDVYGNLIKSIDGDGRIQTTEYDVLGRVIKKTVAPGTTNAMQQTYTYDKAGRVTGTTVGTGSDKTVYTYTYDKLGRLLTSTQGGQTTTYTYDAVQVVGNDKQIINTQKDAKDHKKTTTFNVFGEVIKETAVGDEDNTQDDMITLRSYREDGSVSAVTYNDGTTDTYTYDDWGRITRVQYGSDTEHDYTTYTYNLFAITNMTDHRRIRNLEDPTTALTDYTATTEYSYDDLKRVTQTVQFNSANGLESGVPTNYGYDASGLLTSLTYQSGEQGAKPQTLSYVYNGHGQLTSIRKNDQTVRTYDYTDGGTLSSTTDLLKFDTGNTNDTLKTEYVYSPAGQVTNITTKVKVNGTENTKETKNYTYNDRGFIQNETLTDTFQDGKTVTKSYTYDNVGRLTAENTNTKIGTGNGIDKNTTYAYDAVGNRTQRVQGENTYSYTYNGLNQLTGIKKNNAVDATYDYDARGRQSQQIQKTAGEDDTITTYQYDAAGNLSQTKATRAGNVIAQTKHLYNGDGQRIRQEAGQDGIVNYVYTGQGMLYSTDENNILRTENIIDLNGQTIASKRFSGEFANKYYFFNTDIRGSVTSILGSDGNPEINYTYDAYGNTQANGNESFINDHTFANSIADKTTGLQYMNARFYDANTGRFLSQDAWTGDPAAPWTQHLYAYAGNNPINFIDPTGYFFEEILGIGGDTLGDFGKAIDEWLGLPSLDEFLSGIKPKPTSTPKPTPTPKGDEKKIVSNPKKRHKYRTEDEAAIAANEYAAKLSEDGYEYAYAVYQLEQGGSWYITDFVRGPAPVGNAPGEADWPTAYDLARAARVGSTGGEVCIGHTHVVRKNARGEDYHHDKNMRTTKGIPSSVDFMIINHKDDTRPIKYSYVGYGSELARIDVEAAKKYKAQRSHIGLEDLYDFQEKIR